MTGTVLGLAPGVSADWPLALALLGVGQGVAAWALWRRRGLLAALLCGLIALAGSLLTLRQMSPGPPPGFGLQPLEGVYLLGNLVGLGVAGRYARGALRGASSLEAGRPLLVALWCWNLLSIGLLTWLATRFRLFG